MTQFEIEQEINHLEEQKRFRSLSQDETERLFHLLRAQREEQAESSSSDIIADIALGAMAASLFDSSSSVDTSSSSDFSSGGGDFGGAGGGSDW